jgi:NADP-dependent 3-hydroxy acid dehydrogenase YdfG
VNGAVRAHGRKIDDWDRTIDVGIKGVLQGVAAALPYMKERKAGRIINVSSVAGQKVGPEARSMPRPNMRCG